jgi:hypothetical protein
MRIRLKELRRTRKRSEIRHKATLAKAAAPATSAPKREAKPKATKAAAKETTPKE